MYVSDIPKVSALAAQLQDIEAFIKRLEGAPDDGAAFLSIDIEDGIKSGLNLTVKDARRFAFEKREEVLTTLKNWGIVPDPKDLPRPNGVAQSEKE